MPGLMLTDNDRRKIRTLLRAASVARNMVAERDLIAIALGDISALRAAIDAAQQRDNAIRLQSSHLIAYDILIEGRCPMEHLSVSHPIETVNERDMLVIATEFGLGDRSTWMMVIPPRPPMIRAFHVMRPLGKNDPGAGHG